MSPQLSSKKVAVIGAGASGLVAARELKKEGHDVVVLERGTQVGGTWVYTDEVESDPVGLDPTRKIVQSSLYASLRTNLPREAMGFRHFPFVSSGKADRDSRRFPAHQEVLKYLEDFACEFGLNELIHFRTEVRHVALEMDGKWMVKYRRIIDGDEGSEVTEIYDAVVVCNGHYTEPRIATDISGIDLWPGRQIHSHNYRIPEPYKDQIDKAHEDGRVSFQDGSVILADVILHCTGYKQHFPFLHIGGVVNVDDNRVGPLYKHVFPPALAPGISFVGVPSLVLPFFVSELQSKWISGVLSGRISLPSEEKMMEDVEAFYSELEAKGVPKRYTHKIHDFKRLYVPFEYEDWLAVQSGCPPAEEWRKNMFFGTAIRMFKETETNRDVWDDEDLVLQAHEDFKQYLSAEGKAVITAPGL